MYLLNLSKPEITAYINNLESNELINLQSSLLTQFLLVGNQGVSFDTTILKKFRYATELIAANIQNSFTPAQTIGRVR